MLERLKQGFMTDWDPRFYEHELIESEIMTANASLSPRAAHLATLERQGINYERGYESQLYHPDVIRQFSEWFPWEAWPK